MKKRRSTWHHIVPTSRLGVDRDDNVVLVDQKLHRDYHRLFENKTPEEIITFLVEVFWQDDWKYVRRALNEHEYMQGGGTPDGHSTG